MVFKIIFGKISKGKIGNSEKFSKKKKEKISDRGFEKSSVETPENTENKIARAAEDMIRQNIQKPFPYA